MGSVAALTELNGSPCSGRKPGAQFEVSEWKDVAEGRQILFVLTNMGPGTSHICLGVDGPRGQWGITIQLEKSSCFNPPWAAAVCLWSHVVQVLLEHLGEGGSRGVEFVRNPRPKFFKNSLTQVNATSWCYVWLNKYSVESSWLSRVLSCALFSSCIPPS